MRLVGAAAAAPCVALDIGGTKVEAALVSGDGIIGARQRLDVKLAGDNLFEEIVALVQRVREGVEVTSLGVACAGPMSQGGVLVSPLNIPVWREFALHDRLVEATQLRVDIEGDVRALALAEGAFGAARDLRNYASMVVSTGIGGALVLDGRLVDGASGNSGHLGHLNVVPGGHLCSCGSLGCLEAEASGWAIEALTGRTAQHADASTRLRTATLVGRAVGTLASVLDFTHCFVAGSVALGFGDDFFATATKAACEVATIGFLTGVEVRRSGIGPDGPILGAACVAWRGAS